MADNLMGPIASVLALHVVARIEDFSRKKINCKMHVQKHCPIMSCSYPVHINHRFNCSLDMVRNCAETLFTFHERMRGGARTKACPSPGTPLLEFLSLLGALLAICSGPSPSCAAKSAYKRRHRRVVAKNFHECFLHNVFSSNRSSKAQ